MKICYVANSRFPSERAHATQVFQLCNAFSELGHNVTLVVTDRKTDIALSPEEYYGAPLKFSIVRIPVPDMAGRAPSIPELLRPFAYTFQRAVFTVRAALHIRSGAFDLIYGRDEWILWFLRILCTSQVVWESHEAKHTFAARRLLKRTRRLVAISEGIRDFYIQQGIPSTQILVAHDAVDSTFFDAHVGMEDARKRLGITATKPVVMYIGGLDAWKGVGTLFEAAVNQELFDVYVIGGKDNERILFEKKYPQVHFLGQRPYKDLPIYQQAADILVIPNTGKNKLSSEYTSPLKLFAHMTSKRPIVASRITSLTNVLNDDEAYFFTADDAEDLRDTIQYVLTNDREAHDKAERAHQKSLRYTWVGRAQEIATFIGCEQNDLHERH